MLRVFVCVNNWELIGIRIIILKRNGIYFNKTRAIDIRYKNDRWIKDRELFFFVCFYYIFKPS